MEAVVDTWADTAILPVDPRYKTVFDVDKPDAHVSLPMEAWADKPILPMNPRYRTVFHVD